MEDDLMIQIMDPEFDPGEDQVQEEMNSELLEESDESNYEPEESSESGEFKDSCDVYAVETLAYDDTLLIQQLEQLHGDFMIIILILVLMLARSCFHHYRELISKSYKAIGR